MMAQLEKEADEDEEVYEKVACLLGSVCRLFVVLQFRKPVRTIDTD